MVRKPKEEPDDGRGYPPPHMVMIQRLPGGCVIQDATAFNPAYSQLASAVIGTSLKAALMKLVPVIEVDQAESIQELLEYQELRKLLHFSQENVNTVLRKVLSNLQPCAPPDDCPDTCPASEPDTKACEVHPDEPGTD